MITAIRNFFSQKALNQAVDAIITQKHPVQFVDIFTEDEKTKLQAFPPELIQHCFDNCIKESSKFCKKVNIGTLSHPTDLTHEQECHHILANLLHKIETACRPHMSKESLIHAGTYSQNASNRLDWHRDIPENPHRYIRFNIAFSPNKTSPSTEFYTEKDIEPETAAVITQRDPQKIIKWQKPSPVLVVFEPSTIHRTPPAASKDDRRLLLIFSAQINDP